MSSTLLEIVNVKIWTLVFLIISVDRGRSSPVATSEESTNWKCDVATINRKKAIPNRCYSYHECQWKGIDHYEFELKKCYNDRAFEESLSACVHPSTPAFKSKSKKCDDESDKIKESDNLKRKSASKSSNFFVMDNDFFKKQKPTQKKTSGDEGAALKLKASEENVKSSEDSGLVSRKNKLTKQRRPGSWTDYDADDRKSERSNNGNAKEELQSESKLPLSRKVAKENSREVLNKSLRNTDKIFDDTKNHEFVSIPAQENLLKPMQPLSVSIMTPKRKWVMRPIEPLVRPYPNKFPRYPKIS